MTACLNARRAMENQKRQSPETFDLLATVVTGDAPVAEVLAVISQQMEGVFAQSRARALHNMLRRMPRMRMIDEL